MSYVAELNAALHLVTKLEVGTAGLLSHACVPVPGRFQVKNIFVYKIPFKSLNKNLSHNISIFILLNHILLSKSLLDKA